MLILLSACSSGTTVSDKDIPDANGQREIISDVPPVDVIPDVQREIDWKGTDAQWDIPHTECLAGQGHFGCPCVGADDCLSGWCQLHLGDMVCTQVCVTECPEGFSCVTVGATDPVSICTSRYPSLCLPCRKDGDCDGKGTACLNYGALQGSFCTQKCNSDGDCTEGYDCETRVTVTGATFKGCVASSGECSCTEYAILGGLNTECRISNSHGNCSGVRECGEEGLTPCDALTPEPETCDGVDNDCNGATDEGELCDDGNECTNTWCDGINGCQIENLEHASTDDGDPCTVDLCVDGVCAHPAGNDGATCVEDGNVCTLDICADGVCTHPPGNDGGSCDDGDPCTLDDVCSQGICTWTRLNPLCQAICGDGVCSTLESGDPASEVYCAVDCGACGDGICGLHEMGSNGGSCPKDCLAVCGNGKCEGGESTTTCILDCSGCGDGMCGMNESFVLCPADCPPACGNGICEMFENPQVCPVDCMPPCGDGICSSGESPQSCPVDCPVCGDGVCGTGETIASCPQDCAAACGNGICEGGETSEGCPVDCGHCGDGVCGYHERPDTCPSDCFQGCGDGVCAMGETCITCPMDCGQCCGNGLCEASGGESTCTCPVDCGQCQGCCSANVCRVGTSHSYCGMGGAACLDCKKLLQSCVDQECVFVCGDGLCGDEEDCGTCPADCGCTGCGNTCQEGVCTFSACSGKECGEDGCGGSCGTCTECGDVCLDGICTFSACLGRECGDDGCGGSCGGCLGFKTCPDGTCVAGDVVTPVFVAIAADSFWMGSPDGTCPEGYPGSCTLELGRSYNETLHYVQLTRDFEMQAHEVTQAEWKAAFAGWNPTHFLSCGNDCPVEQVSWFDVIAYANWLSQEAGLPVCYGLSDVQCEDGAEVGSAHMACMNSTRGGIASSTVTVTGSGGNPYNCTGYRLPTEAEWEYAYRAGSTTAFYPSTGNNGSITQTDRTPLDPNLDKIGWYGGISDATYMGAFNCSGWYPGATTCGTQAVGSKAPNAWGLYDMSGNVWEWVWDSYADSYPTGTVSSPNVDPFGAPGSEPRRGGRGGGWKTGARYCRAAFRNNPSPYVRHEDFGARLARTLTPSQCVPDCADKECGDDGCGGSCGTCPAGLTCDESGTCSCGESCIPGTVAADPVVDEFGSNWMPVPGGCFCMGCSQGDTSCSSSELPVRSVQVAPFLMMRTEVTESLFLAIIGANPSAQQRGDAYPVESVDWTTAGQFCDLLGGRLPTEAEWEYAARAGTTTRFTCGDSISCATNVAWYHANSNIGDGWQKHPVGAKQCNAWGLCDMIGNVFEWVEDCWHANYDSAPEAGFPPWTANCTNTSRVARGGGFGTNLPRVSMRVEMTDLSGASFLGFRCVKPWCGSGTCDAGESCHNCPSDCGECCGNGWCDEEHGENCGSCPTDCGCTACGETCQAGVCTFTACDGKECGDDGCGGNCGTCPGDQTCQAGECVGGSDLTPGFVQITKGTFWMGSPDGTCPEGYPGSCTSELGRGNSETLHYVQLTRSFEMQAHEVTQGQWKSMFSGSNPSYFPSCGDNCPVERVTWFSVLEYANAFSVSKGYPSCYTLTGCTSGTAAAGTLDGCTVTVTGSGGNPYNCTGYRLPTEAEWEYAARAGSNTAFFPSPGNDGSISYPGISPLDSGLDRIGWYGGNSYAVYSVAHDCSGWYTGATTCGPQPVGGKAPNALGLYDMSGNVGEWVWDRYAASYPSGTTTSPNLDPVGGVTGSNRVARGHGWPNGASSCRLAYRDSDSPGVRWYNLGARLVKTVTSPCSPNCDGKECGDDGCGGSCGTCETHYDCQSGQCVYVPWCGDGTCNLDEDCDTCSEDCGACCGNGAVDDGEECDLGPMNSDSEADSCRTNCKNAHCGDGVIDADEECDDSNLSNGDGCDSQCMDEPHGPFPGDIIITEIMNNPHLTADAFGEYFEVYNTRDYPIDINRWEIASSGDPVHTIEHSGPLLVPPFGYAVLGLSGDFELNGGVPVDYVYSNLLLLNGADTLKISFNGTDIDVVAYDGGPEFPSPSGPSMNLDPDHFDHISNNNGASWCFSTEPLPSGDKGTPGQPNTPCP